MFSYPVSGPFMTWTVITTRSRFPVCVKLQGFADVVEGVVVAHQAKRAAWAYLNCLVCHYVLHLQPKLIHFDVFSVAAFALVDALGNQEEDEEDEREGHAADRLQPLL